MASTRGESGDRSAQDEPPPPRSEQGWREALKALGDVGSVGIEMGMAISVGYFLGVWLDDQLGTKPYLMYFFLVAGIGAAFKALLRVAKRGLAEAQRGPTPAGEAESAPQDPESVPVDQSDDSAPGGR